jgi:calcineurin-like phosphoesterase
MRKTLLEAGADVITLGDHAFDQRDMLQFIGTEPRMFCGRSTLPRTRRGRGRALPGPHAGARCFVTQALGQVFMKRPFDDPFSAAGCGAQEVSARRHGPGGLVDIHAEATSEKMAMGHFCDGRASLVVGTHTHVPTADAMILPRGTGYLTDAGMCGDYHSVIGMQKDEPLRRFITGMPKERFTPALRRGDAVGRLWSRPTTAQAPRQRSHRSAWAADCKTPHHDPGARRSSTRP